MVMMVRGDRARLEARARLELGELELQLLLSFLHDTTVDRIPYGFRDSFSKLHRVEAQCNV